MLTFDRHGRAGAPPVLLLHGWPGDRHDQDAVAARLADDHDVLVPDLRGFGESHAAADELPAAVGLDAQVRELVSLLEAEGLRDVVVGGYDVGSRVAQALAAARPDLVRALVLAPPFSGAGRRVLDPERVGEFWYQSFHQLELAEELVDGDVAAARAYLKHFWSHWSGPAFTPADALLDRLAAVYGAPGAFTASISWYRAGAGTLSRALAEQEPRERLAIPLHALWPRHDPLFPLEWSDALDRWFSDVTLTPVDCGHFLPVEAPAVLADAIRGVTAGR